MTTSDSAPGEQTDLSPALVSTPTSLQSSSAHIGWWRLHVWPFSGMIALLVGGLAYTFFWYPVVHHIGAWNTPPDLWGTFRDAHYIIWDGEGLVYNANTNFVTFPGIAVLLSPFAEIQQAFHLTESFPVFLDKPTAWYVLGPVDMLCGGILLFPLDAIARRLCLTNGRRALATFFGTVLIFPVVVFWGHPEDTLALALALYALLAAYDRKWLHSAFFFALAVVFQPLILLILPIALAYVPFKKWPAFAAVTVLPTAVLLIPPLVQEWKPTIYAIIKQPNFPTIDHATPWLGLAPVLTRAGRIHTYTLHYSKHVHKFVWAPVREFVGETVAAGPGRTIALVLACLVGVYVARRKPPLAEVIWWAAFALALRCVFESVMDPYYVVPSLVLVVVLAFQVGKVRFLLTLAAVAVCTKTSYWHTGEWKYYLFVTVSLLAALAFSWPAKRRREVKNRETGVPEPLASLR
jgi:hypothetical protein